MQDTEEMRSGKCPPPANGSKDEFSKCATWIRTTSIPLLFWKEPSVYYVFEIADAAGNPVQPYFDFFLARAENLTSPDAAAWKKNFGTDMPADCREQYTSMLDRSSESIYGHTIQWPF